MTTTDIYDVPREFEIPDHVQASHTAVLARAAAGPATTRRVRSVVVGAAATIAVTAAVATAATSGLFDRDVTRSDIDARVTTATRTPVNCGANGECSPGRPETMRETRVVPADGVTFVAPDGTLFVVTPATGTVRHEGTSPFAGQLARSVRDGKEVITVSLAGGGTRTISFTAGEGRLAVADAFESGSRVHTFLRSGDVVPLVPGTLAGAPLTPDKAVTFDLGGGVAQAWIYPGRNEAYVGSPPWLEGESERSPVVPAELAARYRLTARDDGAYGIPISAAGGRWVYETASGRTRTVTWHAGERVVRVTDHSAGGARLGDEIVRVGRRVDAG